MPEPADEIAPGYRRDAELSPGTFGCTDAAGRRWVLKRLPDDCRHANGLHPAIRDRLARVRELPHARVATLAGVVRGPAGPYLLWAHVDGQPLGRADVTAERFPAVVRHLVSAVETLHARGLVHGGLTAGNVIVTPAGDVWLTHLSPYLWDDPAEDARAVVELLRPLADRLGLPLPAATSLRDLAVTGPPPVPPAVTHRRRSLAAAAAVAVAALAAAAALTAWAARSVPTR